MSEAEGPLGMEFPEFSWQNHKRTIVSQVAEALAYLHSLQPKTIHRELKSKNVLINTSMEAKLGGFGIACERCPNPRSHTMIAGVRTLSWIAPEVRLGKEYTERADVFSFGVVMCEMDTGDYPYHQMHQLQIAHQAAGGGGGADNKQFDGSSSPNVHSCSRSHFPTILQLIAHGQLRPEMSINCPVDIARLANDCLVVDPDLRPTAAEIVTRLSQLELSISSDEDGIEDISLLEEVDED